MRATLAGLAADSAFERRARGRVLASFTKACYVELPTGLIALVAPDVLPGPIHVVLDGQPPEAAPGTAVAVTGSMLEIGGVRIRTRDVVSWRGELPDPDAMRTHVDMVRDAARRIAMRSALATGALRDRAERARAALLAGDLDEAAALLIGLGPGLTPSGDDALAGILLVLRSVLPDGFERYAIEIAHRARTTEPARAFLSWAARGQALAAAHDLLLAGARGDEEAATTASERLGRVGETSGSDFLLGLSWALEAVGDRSGSYREGVTSR